MLTFQVGKMKRVLALMGSGLIKHAESTQGGPPGRRLGSRGRPTRGTPGKAIWESAPYNGAVKDLNVAQKRLRTEPRGRLKSSPGGAEASFFVFTFGVPEGVKFV